MPLIQGCRIAVGRRCLMAEKKKMSVADILAAARADKQSVADSDETVVESAPAGTDASPAESPTSEAPESAAKPAAMKPGPSGRPSVQEMLAKARADKATPSAEPKATTKPGSSGGRPSVQEMLAMARANKATPSAESKATTKPAAKQPAAKKDGDCEAISCRRCEEERAARHSEHFGGSEERSETWPGQQSGGPSLFETNCKARCKEGCQSPISASSASA